MGASPLAIFYDPRQCDTRWRRCHISTQGLICVDEAHPQIASNQRYSSWAARWLCELGAPVACSATAGARAATLLRLQIARQDEDHIGEAIEVTQRMTLARLTQRAIVTQTRGQSLGAPDDGARQVECGALHTIARNDELVRDADLGLQLVLDVFEPAHTLIGDAHANLG